MLNFHKLTPFLNQQHGPCVVITEVDLDLIQQSLKVLGLTKKILTYPAIGVFPYDPTPPSAVNAAERIKTIQELKVVQDFCLLITPLAWFEKRPIIDSILSQRIDIQVNDTLTHRHLMDVLTLYSFQSSDMVTQPGQYVIRGDRADVFPPHMAHPVRIDFFGDTVEAIKVFDPVTQKSMKTVPKIALRSAGEFLLNQENIDYYRKNYADRLSKIDQEIVEQMISQQSEKNWGHLWPLFYDTAHPIRDFWIHTPEVFIEPTIDLKKIWQNIQDTYTRSHEQGRFVLPPEKLYEQNACAKTTQ